MPVISQIGVHCLDGRKGQIQSNIEAIVDDRSIAGYDLTDANIDHARNRLKLAAGIDDSLTVLEISWLLQPDQYNVNDRSIAARFSCDNGKGTCCRYSKYQ